MIFTSEDKWFAFGFVVVGAHLVALAAWPFLTLRSRTRIVFLAGAVLLVFLGPLLIPTEAAFLRFLAGCIVFFVSAKMMDYVRVRSRDGRPGLGFSSYLGLLFHPSAITLEASRRRLPANRPMTPELRRIGIGALILAIGIWVMSVLFSQRALESSFLLDHTVKLVGLLVCVESFSLMWHGVMRLFRLDVPPLSDFCFLSLSPTELWRRYNTIVGPWLRDNFYIPAGGKSNRAKAVLLTFAVSGIVHEYVFGIGIGRITGYQMGFFMIQGLGVAYVSSPSESSRWVGPSRPFLSWAATMLFMLLTSILFLASFGQLLPSFYAARPWLP
jgi:hypothetical protein